MNVTKMKLIANVGGAGKASASPSPVSAKEQKSLGDETLVASKAINPTRQNTLNMNPPTTLEAWLPEARQLAAQCWCDEETKHITMDTVLAEAVARRIAAWMDSAAMFGRNSDFYRGIVVQIGEMFGKPAYTSDDGSIQQDVLALKVPELVRESLEKLLSLTDGSSLVGGASLENPPASPVSLHTEEEEKRLVKSGATIT